MSRLHKWDNFIKENIAYAKSILNKNGITKDSPEWNDYLKIREICGNDNGYVGILTKLRFVEDITDFEELASIYEVLKKSKFDFAKLNKLTYSQILDLFYDELSGDKEKNKDYELIHKDEIYSYYRVYTYEGIMEIGSPAWCLKTKSNWDKYQEKYSEQWVVIHNKYKKRLVSPNSNYLSSYSSNYGYIRYGISINQVSSNQWDYLAFDDSNKSILYETNQHTFFGVMSTIIYNLNNGIMKSYFERFPGCQKYKDSNWHEITNTSCLDLLKVNYNKESTSTKYYMLITGDYSLPPGILVLEPLFRLICLGSQLKSECGYFECGKYSNEIIETFGLKHESYIFLGLKLKAGIITLKDIESDSRYVKKVNNWIVMYTPNKNGYLVVNMNPPQAYQMPLITQKETYSNMTNPLGWILYKDGTVNNGYSKTIEPFMIPVINDLIDGKVIVNKKIDKNLKPKRGLLSRFKDFFTQTSSDTGPR